MASGTSETAGIGDPYWYEWSVGLRYVIQMLDRDTEISSVTFQQSGQKGLDDVVVRFSSGESTFIQVKHTREGDSLTFGDLVATDDHTSSTLLRGIAEAWRQEHQRGSGRCRALLVTNRNAGTRRASVERRGSTIVRPPLDKFLLWLQHALETATSLAEIVPDSAWQQAWEQEWLPQLDGLGTDALRLEFLRSFEICTDELGLVDMGTDLCKQLSNTFGVEVSFARTLLGRLDTALRRWATTSRGNDAAVTVEAAYEALCVSSDRLVGEHELPPPAPFFPSRIATIEGIEVTLRDAQTKVVFLTGDPGSGKTALVSELANRRQPTIDLRYHAYRPITPEQQLLPADAGRTATGAALWGDLLIQLRALARGQMARHRVPVDIAFLSTEQRRGEVLRIASALGVERGRAIVIAVDGIDHAARSGTALESLLATLVGPSQVPEGVRFVIAGQLPDAYSAYPGWLRSPNAGVRRIDLPRLDYADARAIVAARHQGGAQQTIDAIAREIDGRCGGNPLATVFALEEAEACGFSLEILPRVLSERALSDGVEAYYAAIWSAAAARHGLEEASENRVAACLALSPIRLTGEALSLVVDSRRSFAQWADTLRAMRPLVVEESGGWRLFHNDVRMFLGRRLLADPSLYKDCASQMADFIASRGDGLTKHESLQNLYGFAGRRVDQARLFSPSYVVSGHAVGYPLDALVAQGLVAADAVIETGDWDLTHSVACGLRTVIQLDAALDWRGDESEKLPNVIAGTIARATKRAECGVTPLADWSGDIVSSTLRDIQQLAATGEIDRAQAAFQRWFGGMSPAQVVKASRSKSGRHPDAEAQSGLSLAELLGQTSLSTRLHLPRSKGRSRAVARAEAGYARGLLKAARQSMKPSRFLGHLRRIQTFYFADFHELLEALILGREWRRLAILCRIISPKREHEWPLRISMAVAAHLLRRPRLRKAWLAPLLAEKANAIAGAVATFRAGSKPGAQLTAMTALVFLLGAEEPGRDPSAIRAEVETVYRRTTHDSRSDAVVSQVLYAGALLGAIASTSCSTPQVESRVSADLLRRVIRLLLESSAKFPFAPIGYEEVAEWLMQGFADATATDPSLSEVVRDELASRMTSSEPLGQFLDVAWTTLRRHGQINVLTAYADAYLGDTGIAWSAPPTERHRLVTRLASLLEQTGEASIAAAARSRLRWGAVAYTGHKEYALYEPLGWFEPLAKIAPQEWSDGGTRLLVLSREATRAGDNRVGRELKTAVVAAACADGPKAVDRLMRADGGWLTAESHALTSGLIEWMRNGASSAEPLFAAWVVCVAQLSWQSRQDHDRLADAAEAVAAACRRLGDADLPTRLLELAPAEAAAQRERSDATGPGHDFSELDGMTAANAVETALQGDEFARWSALAHVLDRVARERPQDSERAVALAWDGIQKAEHKWVWSLEGRLRVYERIFPFLSSAQRWDAVVRAIQGLVQEVPIQRANALARNLAALCLLDAVARGEDPLRRGLSRSLSMHECWVTGDAHLGSASQIVLPPEYPDVDWLRFALEILFKLSESDLNAYRQSALRGLSHLLTSYPQLLGAATELVDAAGHEAQRYFMMIAEPLAMLPGAGDLRGWLEDKMVSDRLDTALAAWLALRGQQRATSKPLSEWPSPPPGDARPRLIVPVAAPLVFRPAMTKGTSSVVGRASTRLLEDLAMVCEDRLDDINALFAASVRSQALAPAGGRTQTRRVGDMSTEADPELDDLMRLLRSQEREGRFRAVDPIKLAQALVPAADPRVFLRSPTPLDGDWPVDETLDKVVGSKLELEAQINELISRGLADDQRVVAASVHTYSSRWDAVVRIDHCAAPTFAGADERPMVLNGRSCLAFEEERLTVSRGGTDQEWLTRRIGALYPFVDGHLEFFPGRLWRRFGWAPLPQNPLEWWKDGERVCWFARFHGPVRSTHGDYLYRQPTLTRWVCTSKAWSAIANELRTPIGRRIQTEIAPLRGKGDW